MITSSGAGEEVQCYRECSFCLSLCNRDISTVVSNVGPAYRRGFKRVVTCDGGNAELPFSRPSS